MSSACALGTVTSYRGRVSNTSPAMGCLAGPRSLVYFLVIAYLADSVTDMSTSTRLRLVPKAVSPGACLQSKAVKGTKRYLASSVTAQALHSVLWARRRLTLVMATWIFPSLISSARHFSQHKGYGRPESRICAIRYGRAPDRYRVYLHQSYE